MDLFDGKPPSLLPPEHWAEGKIHDFPWSMIVSLSRESDIVLKWRQH